MILSEFGNSTVTATVTKTSTVIHTTLGNQTTMYTLTNIVTVTHAGPSYDPWLLVLTFVAVLAAASMLVAMYRHKKK